MGVLCRAMIALSLFYLIARTTSITFSPSSPRNHNTVTVPASRAEDAVQAPKSLLWNVRRNAKLLVRGTKGLISNCKIACRLQGIQKTGGQTALSYSNFKFLETAKEDLNKIFRLGVTATFSPKILFYSYVVFPLISTHNPWAWRSLPSTFDHPEDAVTREQALTKRRMQTAVLAIHSAMGDTLDDVGTPVQRRGKTQITRRIERALKQQTIGKALEELAPWLTSPSRSAANNLQVSRVPPLVVKQCVRALGGDGVPNIPIVRRLNSMELGSKLRSVGRSDAFLLKKGVAALSPAEVRAACFERCIGTENRSEVSQRADLSEWLALSNAPISASAIAAACKDNHLGVNVNIQNTRLAMMALHSARNIKASDFGSTYRALCATNQE